MHVVLIAMHNGAHASSAASCLTWKEHITVASSAMEGKNLLKERKDYFFLFG